MNQQLPTRGKILGAIGQLALFFLAGVVSVHSPWLATAIVIAVILSHAGTL